MNNTTTLGTSTVRVKSLTTARILASTLTAASNEFQLTIENKYMDNEVFVFNIANPGALSVEFIIPQYFSKGVDYE